MNKLNTLVLLLITLLLTGCSNEEESSNKDNVKHNHSDNFVALEYKTEEQIIEEIVPVEPISKDEALSNLSNMTSDDLDVASENTIDLSNITSNDENVLKVLNNLYTENSYESHEVIKEVYSEMPELDGFNYCLVVRFNTNEVYVIYQSNNTAYAYKDEYNIY